METSSAAAAEAQSGGGMSEVGRLIGVFWEPKPVYADLAQRPRWIVPLVLTILLAVFMMYAFSSQVGWDTFMEQEMANNSRMQNLPAEQRQQIIEQQVGIAGVMGYVGAVVGGAVTFFAIAGILLLLFKMVGGSDLKFKQSLAIVSYSWLPFVLYTLLTLIVLYVNPRDFNLKAPLPFNVAWFLEPTETAAWLMALARGVDLFTFWVIALMALGYSVAAKGVRFGTAFGVVFGGWLVMTLMGVGWAALMG